MTDKPYEGLFKPIRNTTAVSGQNQTIQANRPKNSRYQVSEKGRFIPRHVLAAAKFWGDIQHKRGIPSDACAEHVRYMGYRNG